MTVKDARTDNENVELISIAAAHSWSKRLAHVRSALVPLLFPLPPASLIAVSTKDVKLEMRNVML